MKRYTLLACLLLVALPSAAGVVYEIEVKDHEQSPPKTESMEASIEGRNLKMEIASSDWSDRGGRGDMVFRGDRREMVVVYHDDKTYFVLDEETMKALAAQVNEAMSMMDQALANVPEDKRAMVEKMMKDKMPQAQAAPERPKSELKKTGERATHSGYPCVKYEVLLDGRKIRELWVTDWANIEGGAEVGGVFEDMSEFFKELLDSIPQFADGGGADQPFFEHLQELGGFPVVTRDFDDGGDLESESTLRSARRRTLDPSAFDPPSGYKRRSMLGNQ